MKLLTKPTTLGAFGTVRGAPRSLQKFPTPWRLFLDDHTGERELPLTERPPGVAAFACLLCGRGLRKPDLLVGYLQVPSAKTPAQAPQGLQVPQPKLCGVACRMGPQAANGFERLLDYNNTFLTLFGDWQSNLHVAAFV